MNDTNIQACLIIKVIDNDSGYTLAHYSVMVEDIRQGYRIVPLFEQGQKMIPMANLLCHFTIEN
jgi:hypothetical protein